MVMIVSLILIMYLAPLVFGQIENCRFGGEQCDCQGETIECLSGNAKQSYLPIEFLQLPLNVTYTILYKNKKISRIGKNSSLSRNGLKLDTLDLSSNNIEIIEQGAFEYTLIRRLYLSWNKLTSLEFMIDSLCQLKELNLFYNNLQYLKKEWFKCKNNMSKLDLSYNKLTSIEIGVFCNLPNLVSLDLYNNQQLKNLDFLTDSLCQLKALYLRSNKIDYLKNEWFKCKNNLSTLDLGYNNLTSIKSGVFCNLPNLVSLDLVVNLQLERIEQGAFCNGSIQTLDLSKKKLTSLDFLTDSLCQLKKLILSDNRIENLKNEWFKCKNKLSTLDLDKNKIILIRNLAFSDLTSLSQLYLQYNQIETIEPFAFSNLNNLIDFDMSDNRIREIKPYAFNNLTSIESITFLAYQFIQTIQPYSFVGLTRLYQLSFEGNILTKLSNKTFVGLASLTELNLRDNYLLTIETGVFDDLLNLQYLELSLNQLSRIEKGHFSSLERLTNLTLDQNRIEIIEPYSFAGQSETLTSLNLNYNKLLGVKKSHFSSLRVLRVLDLSHNQISSIEQGSFVNTTSLIELRLDHNCIFAVHKDLFKNLGRLQSLSMSNNVLIQLDPFIFRHNLSQLKSLNLSFNQIDSLPDLIFNNLTKLRTLDMNNNRLKLLNRSQIFQGMASLKDLDLSNNFIERISIQPIQSTLVSLGLGYNRLNSLGSNGDANFAYLSLIDLSSNFKLNSAYRLMSSLENCQSCKYEFKFRDMSTQFIKDFVQYLSQSPTLINQIITLDLSYNNLNQLIDLFSFSSMSSFITGLYLKNTNINSSVSFLQKFTKLKVLDLSDNQVVLSNEYFYNNKLTTLYLSNMELKDIKNELNPYAIKTLVELDLSRNLIEIIKNDDFNDFIEKLNLSYNKILSIDDVYFHGYCLDLSHNFLTSITLSMYYSYIADIFVDNNKLKQYTVSAYLALVVFRELKLDDNSLDSITFPNAFYFTMDRNNLTSIKKDDTQIVCFLREFSLASNKIAEIEGRSFYNCKDLYKLDLSNNLIANITNQTFDGLLSLKYLNLSSNLIEFFHQDVYDQSKLLTTLDLNNNKIKTIMDKSFSRLIYLEKLYVNSLEMETVSDLTFDGLNAIKFMKLNSIQFDSLQNIEIIKRLSKDFKSKNEIGTWYPSTNIEYKVEVIDARYCSMVLLFARNNILLNLLADSDQYKFFAFCRSLTLADLEYSIFFFA